MCVLVGLLPGLLAGEAAVVNRSELAGREDCSKKRKKNYLQVDEPLHQSLETKEEKWFNKHAHAVASSPSKMAAA